jgi:cobalt-precorrin 5A hydrolase
MTTRRKQYAIYVITKHGLEIAKRIQAVLKDADLYVSPRFISQAPVGAQLLSLPMEPTLRETFQSYDCHIHIISVGAVVRMIAPLLVNKKVDPAIVCVDDHAKFSICVLSGHVGRGNFYTQELATILNNIPVITTASDVGGTLTVDILGRNLGWSLQDADRNVTRGCAAVVNQFRVLFVQECGEPDWWPIHQNLPPGVEYSTTLDQVVASEFEILLIATDRTTLQETHPAHHENSVVYHPKTLILGMGCDKGIPLEVLERGMLKILKEQGLALASVKAIATVDAKKNEPALLQLSEKYKWTLKSYPADVLDQIAGIENPSEVAKKWVGTRSVSEAAALLLANATELLVPKQKYKEEEGGKNMTLAIARIAYPARPQSAVSATSQVNL